METTITTAMAPKNFQTSDRRVDLRRESAVLEALDMFKQPARTRTLQWHAVPAEMLEVIKIAAGDQATTLRWAESSREEPETVRQAAVFFLQQTIAKSGDDKFKMLGLTEDASRDELRLHKRWLLKWLHPDRNPSKWETVLFHRISAVAGALEGALDDRITKPEALGSEPKPENTAPQTRTEHRGRSPHVHKRLRGPVRLVSWKNLLHRAARRILIAAVLLALVFALVMIFDGSLQDTLQSMMMGN